MDAIEVCAIPLVVVLLALLTGTAVPNMLARLGREKPRAERR